MAGNNVTVVTNLEDERLIREGEAAVEGYTKDLDSARRRIMPMARGLCAAKRKHPATQEFGNWLQGSPYQKLGHTDRAALIQIGEHEEVAGSFLLTTSLISPELIWDAIKGSLLPSSATSDDRNSANPPEPAVSIGESDPPSDPPSSRPSSRPAAATVLFTKSRMTVRCGFAQAPRAEEIYELFQNKEARATVGHIWHGKYGQDIWNLIVTALDAGLLVENDRAFSTASLWLLFPSLPRTGKYNLENPEHLVFIRDGVLPAMIACRDKILTNLEQAQEIIKEYLLKITETTADTPKTTESTTESTETTAEDIEDIEDIEDTENIDTTETTSERNSNTEDELRVAWQNELNVILWTLIKLDDRFTRKYGFWRRWPVSEHSVDRLRRAVKFLDGLIPADASSNEAKIEAGEEIS